MGVITTTTTTGFELEKYVATGVVEVAGVEHVRLRCPHSGTTFARPYDATLDLARHRVGCPGCGVTSRMPSLGELRAVGEPPES